MEILANTQNNHSINKLKNYKLCRYAYYSVLFQNKYKVYDLYSAIEIIHKFLHGINSKRGSLLCALHEEKGTCSTKNGLFFILCKECKINNISLFIGAFDLIDKVVITVFIELFGIRINLSLKNYILQESKYKIIKYKKIKLNQLNLYFKNNFIRSIRCKTDKIII